MAERESHGFVFLVGAGPGNPGLLTLRAKEALEQADVLVYDYLAHPAFMNWVRSDCERIYVGKKAGDHTMTQREIESLLIEKAGAGKIVTRLKGGDPFIFGRGSEEAQALGKAKIDFEVVPGVTAALGAAAYSGTPITQRGSNAVAVFVTGHEDPEKSESLVDWSALPKENAMLCVYMGVRNLNRIVEELKDAGYSDDLPVACVEWATIGRQRICRGNLGTIVSEAETFGLNAPAVIFVGENAAMGEELSWYETKPLQGNRIVVTRSQGQASELSRKLELSGAEVIGLPLINIERNIDAETMKDVFDEIASYDWLVFSSPNGVRYFFEGFFETFEDIRSLGFIRIAAVGASTAKEIKKYFVSVDLIPDEANAESLADKLIATDSLDSAKVLVVAGNLGRDVLIDKIEEARAIVDRFEVYKTTPTDLSDHPGAKLFRENGADAIIFTSSSGVRSFVDQAKDLQLEKGATSPKSVSIGPITSAEMKKQGMPVQIQAGEASLDGIVEALIKEFGK